MALPRITVGTVVKLALASLGVGLLLAWLDMNPLELLYWTTDQVRGMLGDAADWVQWAVKYVFIGAVIVVPIWLLNYLWRAARGKS